MSNEHSAFHAPSSYEEKSHIPQNVKRTYGDIKWEITHGWILSIDRSSSVVYRNTEIRLN